MADRDLAPALRVELLGPLRLLVGGVPEAVPGPGRHALHSQVSRLRAQLGPAADRLRSHPGGYRLELAGGELDRQAGTRCWPWPGGAIDANLARVPAAP